MTQPPINPTPQPPMTQDEILREAKEAIEQFNAAAVRLNRAVHALQAHAAVQLVKQP